MKRKNNKGFTLIELLAVIVILGIILTIVVSNVVKYINQARTGSYTDAYQILLKGLRTELIANEMKTGSPKLDLCNDTVGGTSCSAYYEYEKNSINLVITEVKSGSTITGYKIVATPKGSFNSANLTGVTTPNTKVTADTGELSSIIKLDGTVEAAS